MNCGANSHPVILQIISAASNFTKRLATDLDFICLCGYRVTFYNQLTIQYNKKRVHKHYICIDVFQIGANFRKENQQQK